MNKNLKVDEIHNELEKQPGFLRFSSDKNLLTEPIPSFLKFCQKDRHSPLTKHKWRLGSKREKCCPFRK